MTGFAIIRTGGKQYRVKAGDRLRVEKLPAESGEITFGDVLYLAPEGGAAVVGAPTIPGAAVTANILGPVRGPKITVFKKKRRQNYRRKKGHRQDLTLVEIVGLSGAAPKAKTEAKKTVQKKEGTGDGA
ncbi:MAG TPA: 50S ribosomal protein L21 [Rhodospirillaceae bacterium]|jgi:large subunit ribosomal protein L21|nr:50S ribosomal protein L21 [Alphaproteobacteria bacterium]HBH27107.1 50S ribosomal protein L21 [Rhodospirillaceae bacterium]